jgi:hypothetical protein
MGKIFVGDKAIATEWGNIMKALPSLLILFAVVLYSVNASAAAPRLSAGQSKKLTEQLKKKKHDKKVVAQVWSAALKSAKCLSGEFMGRGKIAGGQTLFCSCERRESDSVNIHIYFIMLRGNKLRILESRPLSADIYDEGFEGYKLSLVQNQNFGRNIAAFNLSWEFYLGDGGEVQNAIAFLPYDGGQRIGDPVILSRESNQSGGTANMSQGVVIKSKIEPLNVDNDPEPEIICHSRNGERFTEIFGGGDHFSMHPGVDPPKNERVAVSRGPIVLDYVDGELEQKSSADSLKLLIKKGGKNYAGGHFDFVILATETTRAAARQKLKQLSKAGLTLDVYPTAPFSNLRDGLFIVAAPFWENCERDEAVNKLKAKRIDHYIKRANK